MNQHELNLEAVAQYIEQNQQLKAKLISERDWSQHLRIQLAAEVEKVNKLQQQLAAEREKAEQERLRIWREAPNQPDIQESVIAKLNLVSVDALAAEREKVEAHRFVAARNRELGELLSDERESRKGLELENNLMSEQLAAERERVQTLVDALVRLRRMNDFLSYPSPKEVVSIIDAALAKVVEK